MTWRASGALPAIRSLLLVLRRGRSLRDSFLESLLLWAIIDLVLGGRGVGACAGQVACFAARSFFVAAGGKGAAGSPWLLRDRGFLFVTLFDSYSITMV